MIRTGKGFTHGKRGKNAGKNARNLTIHRKFT